MPRSTSDSAFVIGKVVGTAIAKSSGMIVRTGDDSYELLIRRSFANYLWDYCPTPVRNSTVRSSKLVFTAQCPSAIGTVDVCTHFMAQRGLYVDQHQSFDDRIACYPLFVSRFTLRKRVLARMNLTERSKPLPRAMT